MEIAFLVCAGAGGTVLVCQLAEWHYGLPGLQGRLLGPARNPEQVGAPDVAGLARGDLDAVFLYQTAAQDSGLPFLQLPSAINLGEPDLAAEYARASHTTADGRTFRGVPIRFSATVLTRTAQASLAQRFLTYLLLPAGQELVRAYYKIRTAGVRKRIFEMVKAVGAASYAGVLGGRKGR